jgi:prolyl-tRNA editing enzyme YbaK/EbsC (Cys-tRNA(Pro) deacylase)
LPGDQGNDAGGAGGGGGEGWSGDRPRRRGYHASEVLARPVIDDATAIEARVRERLDALGVTYDVIACDPELADTAAFCAHYGYPLESSANTIVVAARREPGVACACVVLATTRLDVNHKVCELLGVRKASFASAEQTRDMTGMMIGGVTPFGLPEGLPLFIDAQVMQRESVIIGGGSRSMKLQLAPGVLALLPQARTVDGLALIPDTTGPA